MGGDKMIHILVRIMIRMRDNKKRQWRSRTLRYIQVEMNMSSMLLKKSSHLGEVQGRESLPQTGSTKNFTSTAKQ
uniref:Uncharacterized protein n=1 Tax=Brassica oleracea var. oleracea TaxID=109376 RepID=A0A0D3BXW9_BRAOL